jgi:hypothetical protein
VRELTAEQAIFVREYVRSGGRGAESARAAGYSAKTADNYAYQLLQKPHVQEAIHKEQRRTFSELAAIALGQARMMLEDPKTPAGARVELMKMSFDRAGLAALRNADDPPGDDKPLREMTVDELEEIAASLRAQSARGGEEAEPVRRAA